MKISRIFQPRNPLFWMLVVLNLLSMFLSYVAQNYTLSTLASVIVIVFAVLNTVLSMGLAWRLVKS
jgi:drug/metabolite transporter (DMT)-like permease